MHAVYSDTHNTYKNESKHSEMGPVHIDLTYELLALFICMCIALCTIVAHNIAQHLLTVMHSTSGQFCIFIFMQGCVTCAKLHRARETVNLLACIFVRCSQIFKMLLLHIITRQSCIVMYHQSQYLFQTC